MERFGSCKKIFIFPVIHQSCFLFNPRSPQAMTHFELDLLIHTYIHTYIKIPNTLFTKLSEGTSPNTNLSTL